MEHSPSARNGQPGPESTIRKVIEECPEGRRLLYDHGYDVGDGFVDVLSQYQSLQHAARVKSRRHSEREFCERFETVVSAVLKSENQ